MDARRLARASLPSGKQGRVRSCIRRFDAAPTRPLGLMKSADRPPIKASRFAALGTGRVLSIPGATGLPSGHDHPYASSNLRASSCRGRHLFSEWPFLDENCPDDPGCLVGHRHGRNFPWVSTDVQNWTSYCLTGGCYRDLPCRRRSGSSPKSIGGPPARRAVPSRATERRAWEVPVGPRGRAAVG